LIDQTFLNIISSALVLCDLKLVILRIYKEIQGWQLISDILSLFFSE